MPHDFKPSQLHLCNTILFLFLSGQKHSEIDRRLNEVYKKGAPARCTIYKWLTKFASGDYSIEDGDRPGRSMELDLEVLQGQVEADPYQTTRELAVALGECGLKSIGKVRKLGRWVPHALKQYDMDCCADMALSLLTLKRRIRSDVFIKLYSEELFILYLTKPRASIFVSSYPCYVL
ncbi:hypothetical protein V3C99_012348 [Haemonchus contortus]|uniref:HTH_48 domain-containing protein n=1 Tax=Haemonchus contortus TaxID=6289 RepID=A0A7I5E7F3_HAECO